ncbi:MAG: hypothetical protein ACT4P3_07720 [Betaproteobacteria bacterium]
MSLRKMLLTLLPVCVLSIAAIGTYWHSPTWCAVSSFFISNAWADSCTNWMAQSNGCSWRTCVDNKGRQYCQQACRGSVTNVSCR